MPASAEPQAHVIEFCGKEKRRLQAPNLGLDFGSGGEDMVRNASRAIRSG